MPFIGVSVLSSSAAVLYRERCLSSSVAAVSSCVCVMYEAFPANHDCTDAGSFKTDPSDSLPHTDAPHHLCAYGVIRGAERENEGVLINSWMLLLSLRV